ncbi:MAG TPA: ABC transporter ATP-binding protein [Verrucomicrobiae bacterium]|nr:ABC transporter ATP-binding protein [Verrucomicrobiae bacterium]
MPLLSVKNLRIQFHTRNGVVHAVDGVSFQIEKGETLAIVGESGSGKSVTCYSLMGLVPQPPGKIENGSATFDGGVDLLKCPVQELNRIRGRRIAMVFQDPMTSLNPYMRIQDQVIEPLLIHGMCDRVEAVRRGIRALEEVGVPDAANRIRSYPHEFSGGMRQRVMIAMALITNPELLIADEPTTALDVTIQAQILDLLKQLKQRYGMSILLITHNLGIVGDLADKVAVMYAGRMVEQSPALELLRKPLHPYTIALMHSIPTLGAHRGRLESIPGTVPNPIRLPAGCKFHPRCDRAQADCTRDPDPQLVEVEGGTRCVRCPYSDKPELKRSVP